MRERINDTNKIEAINHILDINGFKG